ncbi:MAG: SDR family NAD(P)-dependent oxidoreductase [Microthrixaceae bacterium]
MARSLENLVIAVLGASGGIGSELSGQLAHAGAQLLLAGPHEERLRNLQLSGSSTVQIDLRDSQAGNALAAAAVERYGRLDGLVNAAGVVAFGPLLETDDTVIEELFLTNVIGPLWLLKRVIPLLSESKGFVVNISAVLAEQPMPNLAAYSASKSAMTAADQALHRELRRVGIQVCDVRPPHTETGLATRPLAGVAPKLPTGLTPEFVAARIVSAIQEGATELSADSFSVAAPDGDSAVSEQK